MHNVVLTPLLHEHYCDSAVKGKFKTFSKNSLFNLDSVISPHLFVIQILGMKKTKSNVINKVMY